jgi:hypothetical protein
MSFPDGHSELVPHLLLRVVVIEVDLVAAGM